MSKRKCTFKDCKRKILWTIDECKCGGLFCNKHVFFNDHLCSYDYKQDNTNVLNQKLIKIERKKINKI